MATIKSTIIVQDRASSVFLRIHSNISKTVSGLKNLNNQMSVAPTKSIENAEKLKNSALQTELAYKAELQTLQQVEAEARKIIAAQGTQSVEAREIIASVREQRDIVARLRTDYDKVPEIIKRAVNNQEEFNNKMNEGKRSGDSLINKIKSIAIAAGGIASVKKLVNLSDELTNNRARLNLIVDDKGSVEELQNKIFASSIRARASYQTTTDIISKLGLQAGQAFSGNDELIAFTEQLNKTFAIAGTNKTGIESTMYNLTQALSTGVLRGQDLNSVFSNAPQIVQNIADYLDVPIGKIRDMAAEGKISANIVKNAMLKASAETNATFEKMPMTWSQIWIKIQNIAIKSLEPVLLKINELANNENIQEMLDMFINGAGLAVQAVLGLIEGVSWLINVLEPVAPMIAIIVAGYVIWQIASAVTTGILTLQTFAHFALAAATRTKAAADRMAIASQLGLNTAMLSCPAFWVTLIIMALIVALTYLWFTNDNVAYWMLFAWDAIRLGAMMLKMGVQIAFYGIIVAGLYMLQGILGVKMGLQTAFYMIQLGALSMKLGFLGVCQGIVNAFVWMYNKIAELLNKLGGHFETMDYADFTSKTANSIADKMSEYANAIADTYGQMEDVNGLISEYQNKATDIAKNGTTNIVSKASEWNNTRQERVSTRNDWIKAPGDAIRDIMNTTPIDPSSFVKDNSGAFPTSIDDIAANTKDIADNTAEITDEDLKYLIDLAERETVNRFTTVPLTINLTNNNNINSDDDIDGIVDKVTDALTTRLEEEMEYVADGVHE